MVVSAPSARALLAAALLAAPLAAWSEPKASERDWSSPAEASCALFGADAARLDARTCSSCHPMADHGHPVESDYDQARYRSASGRDLRTLDEVVKRGVRLVGGKVTCVTCHDAASRFGSHLAIPATALVRPAADLRNPASYENQDPVRPVAQIRLGTQVSPKPLCLSCHAID